MGILEKIKELELEMSRTQVSRRGRRPLNAAAPRPARVRPTWFAAHIHALCLRSATRRPSTTSGS
jgi:hypothetical protein